MIDRGKRLGPTFGGFKNRYFDQKPYTYAIVAKKGSEETIQEAVRDVALSMSAADWLTVPERVVVDVPVALDPLVLSGYAKFERDMLAIFEALDTEVVAVNAAYHLELIRTLQTCHTFHAQNQGARPL